MLLVLFAPPYMGLDTRNPVFRVSSQVRFKLVYSAIETSLISETIHVASLVIIQ